MSDFAPGLEAAFVGELPDGELAVERIDGRLPPFLRGTYYLNGPGRFACGGHRYRHWLDGDGRVFAARFAADGVTATARFVRTMKAAEEEAAGRLLYRTFGTAAGENKLVHRVLTASPANVSVHLIRGRLLAFGEQSRPYELDPDTLETREVHDFGGQLNALSPISAHPRTDPHTGETFHFGIAFAPTDPQLHLYCFDTSWSHKRSQLPFPCTVHDFALSGRFAVFHLAPYLLDMDGMRRRGQTTMDSLSWESEHGSWFRVISRDDGKVVTDIPAGGGYCLHAVNAFDDGDHLVVDLIEYPEPLYGQYRDPPELFLTVPPGRPVRYTLDPAGRSVVSRRELAYCRAPDFPVTTPADAGRPYHAFWVLGMSAAGRPGRKFFDQLARCDWDGGVDVFRAPPGQYLAGEPAVVSDATGAVVVCPLFDAARGKTTVAVFDAFAVAAGPVAQVRLAGPVHLGFHATFVPAEGDFR